MRCKVIGTYLDYEHTRSAGRYFLNVLVPDRRGGLECLDISMFDFIRAAGIEKTGEWETTSDDDIQSLKGREFEIGGLIATGWIASSCKPAEGPNKWTERAAPECDRCGRWCSCGDDFVPYVPETEATT